MVRATMRWNGPLRARVVSPAFLLGLLVALGGCTGGDGNGGGGADAADGASIAEAQQHIDDSDLSDPASLSAVDAIRFSPEGVAAASQALDSGASGDALWAAVWVYGTSSDGDPAAVLPVLKDGDASIRVMAAAALVAWGEPEGFEVLVAELENTEPLAGSEPPRPVWEFALTTLERYTADHPTSVPAEAKESDLAVAHTEWSAWLDAHGSELSFDGDAAVWRAT